MMADQIMFAFFGLLIAILMTMVAFSGGGGDYFGQYIGCYCKRVNLGSDCYTPLLIRKEIENDS